MEAKICGVSDSKTLNYIINHNYAPNYIGFICNYTKSKRLVEFNDLKNLITVDKKKINFVSVLVKPNIDFLEKIKDLKFDYYQLYDVNPEQTTLIKEKYKIKIITTITIQKKEDLEKYKKYINISDIILFDSKGYEKSLSFDHSIIKKLPNSFKKMLAGNIKYDEKLDKYEKITDIIDLSGSLETSDKKDFTKIDIFLRNLNKLNDKN